MAGGKGLLCGERALWALFRYFTSRGRVTLVPTVLWIGVKMEHEEKLLGLKARVRGSSLGIVAV